MVLNVLDKLYSCCPQSNVMWRSIRYGIRVSTNLYAKLMMVVKCRKAPDVFSSLLIKLLLKTKFGYLR